MHHFTLGTVFVLSLIKGNAFESAPAVKISPGTIIGTTNKVTFKRDTFEVDAYLGIPYAKPPVGDLRFKKPEPFGTFTEPYNAVKFGHSCPQAVNPMMDLDTDEQSEDCLFLNVYVPRQPADMSSGHAVMLFIHGGGFSVGSANLYKGEGLASVGNVIVVTINYRLSLLGFLDTDDGNSVGNFGLWDQHLALKWVNENIGAFGGDKDRVTLFGQSAGSTAVAMQMMYPGNKGLFRAGITQSGSLTMPSTYMDNTAEAAKYFAENMNCSVETMGEMINCLKSASVEDIMKVVTDTMASMDMTAIMRIAVLPTVDGDFVKEVPTELFKRANAGEQSDEIDFFRSLKLINGLNGQEGAMFLQMLGQADYENIEITREQMNNEQIPGALFLRYPGKELPEVAKQLIIAAYTDWTNPDDPRALREQVTYLNGDVLFNVAGVEMSRIHSNATNVDSYFYNFNAVPYVRLMNMPSWIRTAVHGEELGPVFGFKVDLERLLNVSKYEPPEWELDLSRRMITFWTNFAKTGNPNGASGDELSPLDWPKFDVASQAYIKFDREDSVGHFPYAKQVDFWTHLIPEVVDATEHAQTISSQYGKKETDTCEQGGDC